MERVKKQWRKVRDKVPFRRHVDENVNDEVAFLRLPYEIRYRIYVLAGLVRPCPIDLNKPLTRQSGWYSRIQCSQRTFKGPRNYSSRNNPGRWDAYCECGPVPIQLLHLCRAVNRECSLILYSENSFKICRIGRRGFKPILRLSRPTLSLITSLTVRLNACICCLKITRDKDPSNGRLHTCTGGVKGFDEADLAQWQGLCRCISASIEPSRLAVRVICDTESHGLARKVVLALSDMPRLRSFSIRFSQDLDSTLGPLARKAVHQATRSPPSREPVDLEPKPASRVSLPWEIQRQILAHHPHLTPNHALEWHPVDKFTRRACCGKCTDAPEACCCSGKQAAFSDSCTCWELPTELFLVNSSWCQAATEIFYQLNHFAILSNDDTSRLPRAPGLFEFLSVVPPHARQHLRSIECIFPQLSEWPWELDTRQHKYWLKGLTSLARNIRVDKLTLNLNFSADSYHWRHLDHLSHLGHMSLQNIIDAHHSIGQSYNHVVTPLADLWSQGSLADFFVRAGFDDGNSNKAMEKRLEIQVMGEGYDSISKGKNNDPRFWGAMDACCWERPT